MTLQKLNQYGHEFQIKVLSSLLTHKEFLTNIHDIIDEEYFEKIVDSWRSDHIWYKDNEGQWKLKDTVY